MGWKQSDLTTRTGAPGAIFGVSSYMFVGQGTQHIVYQGFAGDGQGTGRIHELWWNHNGWHHNDLTSDAHAPLASSAPSGYAFEGQLDGGTQHAIYQGFVVGQGDDGRIHEIWWDENDTHHSDLTTDGHAPPILNEPFGYEFQGQNVVYEGDDNSIHHLAWNIDGGWDHTDLTAATGAPLALLPPTAYGFTSQRTHHVLYLGVDRHVHELWRDPDLHTWRHNDLTVAARAPVASDQPSGFAVDTERTQLVHYRGIDGHIHQLLWNGGGWQHLDLTATVGGAAASSGARPTGYAFPFEGTLHVNYLATDGHVHEYWRDGTGWHHNDLTAATQAPLAISNPTAHVFAAQNTQHVIFIADTHHVIELFWVPA